MCCVAVPLSRLFKGSKVVIDGYSIKGEGTVLADAPLHQDRVYWEVTVVKLPANGKFSLGVSRRCVVRTLVFHWYSRGNCSSYDVMICYFNSGS